MTDRTGNDVPATGPRSVLTCPNCGVRNAIRPSARGSPHCGTCGKPLPWVVDATDVDVPDVRGEHDRASVLVDFRAPWCGPCRVRVRQILPGAGPRLGRVGLKVIKVNVNENPRLTAAIRRVQHPDDDRHEGRSRGIDRIVGAAPKPALEARIRPHVGLSSWPDRGAGARSPGDRAPRAVVSVPGHCAAIGVPPRCGGLRL